MNAKQYMDMMNLVRSSQVVVDSWSLQIVAHHHNAQQFPQIAGPGENHQQNGAQNPHREMILVGREIASLIEPKNDIRIYLLLKCIEGEDYLPCFDRGEEKVAVKQAVVWDMYRTALRDTFVDGDEA